MDKKDLKEYKIFFQTILNKYFNIVIIAFMILILVLGFFFVISPKREAISTESNKINSEKFITKGELEDLQKRIGLYKRSYSLIDNVQRKKIDVMLPKEPRTGELMVQLEKLVMKKGLLPQSITVVTRAEEKTKTNRAVTENVIQELPSDVGAVDISLKVQGIDYESLKDFLSEFEKNLRLMDVISLGFSPGQSDLDLKIVTYYSK